MRVMNEGYPLIVLIGFGFVASLLLLYPLRRNRVLVFLFPMLWLLLTVSYQHWGGFVAWRQWLYQQDSLQAVQRVLKTIKTPEDLIGKLKSQLDEHPKSARGWYLLGRLYSSQNDLVHAHKAFAKAYRFYPEEEAFAAAFAHSSWLIQQQTFTPEIRAILKHLLDKNPHQADALSLLALDSFLQHDYTQAIKNWQSLLDEVPEDSKEAKALRRAIAKAYKKKAAV